MSPSKSCRADRLNDSDLATCNATLFEPFGLFASTGGPSDLFRWTIFKEELCEVEARPKADTPVHDDELAGCMLPSRTGGPSVDLRGQLSVGS